MSITRYGSTDLEDFAKDSKACRQIVSEILQFGVTQQQILRRRSLTQVFSIKHRRWKFGK